MHACFLRVAPRGSGANELDMSITLCHEGAKAVTARFIRNELLWLNATENARRRHADRKLGAPALMLCDWHTAAREADLYVLNRGYHSLIDLNIMRELHDLNSTVGALAVLAGTTSSQPLTERLVYRGTHASSRACTSRTDPETRPWAEVDSLLRSRANAQYNWRGIASQGDIARAVLGPHGITYLDTYVATGMRPGGRMPGSCNHFCLPGPIDDWVRLLLAHWT